MDSANGAYDADCERILTKHEADGVLLMVVNGKKGHGMSVCLDEKNPHALDLGRSIPSLLRRLADMVENQGEFKLEKTPQSWSDLAKGDQQEDKD